MAKNEGQLLDSDLARQGGIGIRKSNKEESMRINGRLKILGIEKKISLETKVFRHFFFTHSYTELIKIGINDKIYNEATFNYI